MPARKKTSGNDSRWRGSQSLAAKYRKMRHWKTFNDDWAIFRICPPGTKTRFKFSPGPLRLTIQPHSDEAEGEQLIEVSEIKGAKEFRLFLLLWRLAKDRRDGFFHLGDSPLDPSARPSSRTIFPGEREIIWAPGHATKKILRLLGQTNRAESRTRSNAQKWYDRKKAEWLKQRQSKDGTR